MLFCFVVVGDSAAVTDLVVGVVGVVFITVLVIIRDRLKKNAPH